MCYECIVKARLDIGLSDIGVFKLYRITDSTHIVYLLTNRIPFIYVFYFLKIKTNVIFKYRVVLNNAQIVEVLSVVPAAKSIS